MKAVPALAVLVTGLALYVSRGVLDQVVTADGLVRIALLPPWQTLGGFLALGALALLWLDRRAAPRGTATAVRPRLGPLLLPTFGLLYLLLPYLPVLPDAIAGLQMLAGPARAVIWLIVIAQLVWVLWQARLVRADWLQRASIQQATVAIGIVTALLAGTAAMRFAGTVLYPAGDEPHYLVIAQSLWRDGDLKIENNHARGDYREYYATHLDPHYLTRGADQEIYSIHPVGMPLLITPIYAAGGYPAVVAAFVLMAAIAAAVMWRTTLATSGAGAATFGIIAVVATAPFLFNAFAIYPEIPAALAVALAFTLIVSLPRRVVGWVAVGALCGVLPWLSTKYAPMSAALVAIALSRIVWRTSAPPHPRPAAREHLRPAAAILIPYALSLAGWFYFFYAVWGVPLPQAPYGELVQTDIRYLLFGGPGLLFDQEYGLLAYAPVYILAATGLWVLWRDGGDSRRRAIEVVILFAALLGTVGAFRIWWGGSASPGRPVTSGLLLLALPMAAAFRAAPTGSARRAGQHLLLWASVGVTGILVFAQQGLLTANGRDGTSSLLEYLSPRWPAWTLAPSFIYHEAPTALAHTALWLLLAGTAAWLLRRYQSTRPGAASLVAMLVTGVALLVALVVMPRLPLSPEWPALNVRARARLPLLDRFDAVARPLGIEYAPLQFVRPSDLVTHASVEVLPGVRTDPQPVRVLHNGRFSLPAGTYRIEVQWNGARDGEVLGLQVGRIGEAWQKWRVAPRPGESWRAEFTIPMDASFVGLRGSPDLERAIANVRITPLAIVDAGRRPRGPAFIAASQSGDASVFYYDLDASPEERGFWVWGARRTRVTIHRPGESGALVLRVHSGPIPNRLHLSMFGWQHTAALQPEQRQEIEIPGAGELITLELSADAAFVPKTLDPASTDERALGVWVEVVP